MRQPLILFFTTLLGLGWVLSAEAPRVVSKEDYALAQKKYGALAVKRLEAWQALIDNNQTKPERLKLSLVNDFFNLAEFIENKNQINKGGHWSTPSELLMTDAGGYEDFVVAKYFTLKALGVEEGKIYLTYVTSTRLKKSHMVLTYFRTPKAVPLVLDSLTDRILPASDRKDLIPIYSFNGNGLVLSQQRGATGNNDSMQEWNRLLQKLNKP